MNIDCIEDFETFGNLRHNVESIYSADPQARFFMSWIWLSRVLTQYEKNHEPWRILAAKLHPDSPDYVAFMPLKIELHETNHGIFYNQLSLVGVTDADQVLCISLPEHVDEAISAFAAYLHQREEWSTFKLENIQPTDARFHNLSKQFSIDGFTIHDQHHLSDLDDIDNNIVPFIALPQDWDVYLQTYLSSNSRQRIKRFLRKVEDSNDYQIIEANRQNLGRYIDILRQFWEATWEGRKGADTCHHIFDYISGSLHHCFEQNCLYFPILWRGDQPLGAIANILDPAQKTVLFLVGGRDDTIKDIPTGTVLHAHSIRYAIQQGFKIYDFLMGNEAYKYSFGAQERHIQIVTIQRSNLVNFAQKLDAKTISHALHVATRYHRANRLAEADSRYRQILNTQPDHPEALYGLGVVLHRQDMYPAAEQVLKTLLDLQPDNAKAWFSLGTLYQTQGQLDVAESAYRRALATQPETSAIAFAVYHNLGYTLQQQGQLDGAIACYEKARTLQPDNLEAEAIWANAMHRQGKLSPSERVRYAEINHNLGNHRRQAGDLNVAIEYYRQAIALQPDLVDAHYHLGLVLQTLAQGDEAIACYRTVLTLQPDHRAAEANTASVRHAQGNLAQDQQSHYANVCLELGHHAKQANHLEAALQFYRQAIALQTDLAIAHYHLGLTLRDLGQWEEAIAHYQMVLTLQPTDRDADLQLAAALHRLGRLAPDQQTHYATINHNLGHHYRQTGDLQRAIEHYQLAIAMNPDLDTIREPLRLALQAQNDVQIKVSHAKR